MQGGVLLIVHFGCTVDGVPLAVPLSEPTEEVHLTDLLQEAQRLRRMPTPQKARAIRVTAGVSQQRLADELGVHWTTVARWERGTRRPRGPLRLRYSELLMALAFEVGPDAAA